MTRGLSLVLVYERAKETVYARYEGRACTHRFVHSIPLSAYWVEEIRCDPGQFDEEKAGPEAA